jgi:hypothetical protein
VIETWGLRQIGANVIGTPIRAPACPGHRLQPNNPLEPTVADLQSDLDHLKSSKKTAIREADTVHLQFDFELSKIIAAWPTLPEHLKRAMLAMLG